MTREYTPQPIRTAGVALGQGLMDLAEILAKNAHERWAEQRLTDLGREVGTKLGELGALRERLTRMEGRVVESSKDQITRAGETAGLRDRLTRLESRLGDLSKEQLARAVESAGLRERLFRLEQRSPISGPAAIYSEADPPAIPVED